MFNSILVPLDGSDLAEKALAKAQEMAQATGAVLHLVHVVSHSPELEVGSAGGFGSIALAEYEIEQAKRLIEARIAKGGEYLSQIEGKLETAGVKSVSKVLEGAASEQIVTYIENSNVDLVVVTSRGRGGIKRLILGSVTDYLVRSGAAPVLVWPAE